MAVLNVAFTNFSLNESNNEDNIIFSVIMGYNGFKTILDLIK